MSTFPSIHDPNHHFHQPNPAMPLLDHERKPASRLHDGIVYPVHGHCLDCGGRIVLRGRDCDWDDERERDILTVDPHAYDDKIAQSLLDDLADVHAKLKHLGGFDPEIAIDIEHAFGMVHLHAIDHGWKVTLPKPRQVDVFTLGWSMGEAR